jgi:hypothetical protein
MAVADDKGWSPRGTGQRMITNLPRRDPQLSTP